MTKKQSASFCDSCKKIAQEEISLCTGTMALATAVLTAYSFMPSVADPTVSLLQASVLNLGLI